MFGDYIVFHFFRFVNLNLRILRDLGGEIIYEVFKGKVAEQKQIRRLTYAEIGKMTGYSKNAIAQFMCGARESERVAKAIAKVLDIEL